MGAFIHYLSYQMSSSCLEFVTLSLCAKVLIYNLNDYISTK